MNQQDIEQVVKAVLLKMKDSSQPAGTVHDMGVFASLDDAVAAATVAQQGLKRVAMRQQVIQAIREAGEKYARELAELAVTETGMGRVEDKFAKNVAQARGTPGVECLTPQVLTGDNGLTLIENAPWGVVASVTPSTNPAATVINNAISLIAAGNSVVFAPHPAAKKVSQRAITLLNQAVVAAGGHYRLVKQGNCPLRDLFRRRMGGEDHAVAGGNQANGVVDHRRRRIGGRRHRGHHAPGRIFNQRQAIIAGEHLRSQTLHARRAARLRHVFGKLIFNASHAGLRHRKLRQFTGILFTRLTNGLNHLLTHRHPL